MDLRHVFKIIFIDGQLIGIIVGSIISYILYKISKGDGRETQRIVWKKEFDRFQTEPMIDIFRDILSVLNSNAIVNIKSCISQEHLNKLKIELQLIRYFENDLKTKINNGIYKECLEYNNIGLVNGSSSLSSTDSINTNKLANDGRSEREKRELIENNIVEVVDIIKMSYIQF